METPGSGGVGVGGGSEKAKQSSLLSTWNLGLAFAGHRPPPNTLVHSPRDLGPPHVAPVFPSNLSPQGKSRTAPLRAAPLTFAPFTRRRGAPSSDLPFLPRRAARPAGRTQCAARGTHRGCPGVRGAPAPARDGRGAAGLGAVPCALLGSLPGLGASSPAP